VRPATIRRLLVFGVCAVGVGMLYLIPSVAGTPGQSGSRGSREPQSMPQPIGYVTQRSSEPTTGGAADQPLDAATSPGPSGSAVLPRTEPGQGARRERGAAPQQADAPDRQAPSIVTDLTFPSVSSDRLTLRWGRAADNVGVTSYRIWLNGFRVADTTELQVTVPWFNDGSRQQVVQVRAVDAAGNESEDAPARLVVRPAPSPAPAPAASASTPQSTPSTPSVEPDNRSPIEDSNR
jgi:hypothetical protein